MSTPIAQAQPKWRVTTIEPTLDTAVPTNPVDAHRINFTLIDEGISSFVTVPDSRLGDTGYVTSLIATRAAQLATVAALAQG